MSAAGLAAVALVGAGVTVGLVLAPEPATPDPAETGTSRVVEVGQEFFDDPRQVSFTPMFATTTDLSVLDVGRVTRLECVPGGLIASGSSPVTVDDRPTLALATSIPLWRDLGPGSRGADVSALQTELARLGFEVEPSGAFGAGTRAAVQELFRRAGVARPDGRLPAARVLWLPAVEVRVSSCGLAVGDHTDDGALATLGAGVVGLRSAGEQQGLVEGPRVARFGELAAPVGEDGVVTDPAFLAAIAGSPWLAQDAPTGVPLGIALAEPLDVTVVPPAALFGLAGSSACVATGGQVRAVTVVTSQLGRSYVTFDDGAAAPSSVDLDRPDGLTCR